MIPAGQVPVVPVEGHRSRQAAQPQRDDQPAAGGKLPGIYLKEAEPGRYYLNASHAGYVPQTYGQRRPEGPSRSLTLAPGENLKGLAFRLLHAAVITGHVYDDARYERVVQQMESFAPYALTGAVISHVPPPRVRTFADLDEAARAMKEQDSRKESIFRQSVEAEKNKSDLLEKKFQEALKRAKETPDTGPPIRDFDLD